MRAKKGSGCRRTVGASSTARCVVATLCPYSYSCASAPSKCRRETGWLENRRAVCAPPTLRPVAGGESGLCAGGDAGVIAAEAVVSTKVAGVIVDVLTLAIAAVERTDGRRLAERDGVADAEGEEAALSRSCDGDGWSALPARRERGAGLLCRSETPFVVGGRLGVVAAVVFGRADRGRAGDAVGVREGELGVVFECRKEVDAWPDVGLCRSDVAATSVWRGVESAMGSGAVTVDGS